MQIRKAEINDLKELLEIYNYEVEHGVATLDLHPKTLEEWKSWLETHHSENHPLLVAEIENHVAGYASLSEYREKEAFQSTVELSVYIGVSYRKQGVATALMKAILETARNNNKIHTVVSVITGGNEVSKKLHEKFGFAFCGTIHEVGFKQNQYRDIDNYEIRVS